MRTPYLVLVLAPGTRLVRDQSTSDTRVHYHYCWLISSKSDFIGIEDPKGLRDYHIAVNWGDGVLLGR